MNKNLKLMFTVILEKRNNFTLSLPRFSVFFFRCIIDTVYRIKCEQLLEILKMIWLYSFSLL